MNILSKRFTNKSGLLFAILPIVLMLVSLVFFALSIGKPYMGLLLSKGENGWTVIDVDATGVAINAGIVAGDIPININNQPADEYLAKYENEGKVWGPLINQLTVINAENQIISVNLENNTPYGNSNTETITRLVVCIFCWAAGFYVFIKKPNDIVARLFCLCCFCISLILISNSAAMMGNPVAPYVEAGTTIIGPWLLMHFFLVLPEERAYLRKKLSVYFLYIPAAITLILFLTIGFKDGQPVMWFRSIRLFEYGFGFLAVIGVVVFNYIKATSLRIRQQTKIVLVGCLTALVPILLLNLLPQALWQQIIIPPGFSILFVAFIPVGIAYAIITQKLMDIDVLIRRSIIYGLVTLAMAIILVLAILISVNFHSSLNTAGQILVALVLGGIATALFGPVKKSVEYIIDKIFYKDRFDYRNIIQNLSTSLNSINDFSDMARLIVGTTVNTLNLKGACLFTKGNSSVYDIRTAQGSFTDEGKQRQLESIISKLDTIYIFPNPALGIDPDVSFFIPIVTGNKQIGILCLAHKINRQDFSSGDIYLLQGIALVAAMALHRTMLMRDVNLRDTFVSIASHELRTPLTSIIGYTDLMLQRDPPQATRAKWLGYILDSGKRLNSLVNDLLNVSRIQSGRVPVKLSEVDIAPLIDELLTFITSGTDKHRFVVDIPRDFPLIWADRDKLSQVLSNLLNNAVKYSPSGGTIRVAAGHDDGKNRCVISVTDEGIGISPEDKLTLFTSFHRIQRPETQGIRGSGLGLYIAKEWTEAMGGEIWLQSELNKGSTFFVSIPFTEFGKV